MPPSAPESANATALINAATAGDKTAADRLVPLVYDQLRKTSQIGLAGEAGRQALSATALVHEAYHEMIGARDLPWTARGHFYAAAAQAMRRILLDRAQARDRAGGRPMPLTEISNLAALAEADSERILAVDAAVARLEVDYPEAAAVVRLRFYAGLGEDDAAKALGISPRTAARLWKYARAVLFMSLAGT